MEQKRRKIQKKGRWKIENGRWKSFKMRRGPFFFFVCVCVCFVFAFFFFFFAFHFSKLLKFVVGLPKQEFSAWKKHFTPGKKSRKMTLPPLKTIPLMPLLSLYDFLRGWPIIFMPKGGPEFFWGGGGLLWMIARKLMMNWPSSTYILFGTFLTRTMRLWPTASSLPSEFVLNRTREHGMPVQEFSKTSSLNKKKKIHF